MLAFVTFSISTYIMCVILCLFSVLSRRVCTLQIYIIIIITNNSNHKKHTRAPTRTHTHACARARARTHARTHAHTHTHTADNCNKDRSQKRYERLVELLDVERPVNRKRSDLRWRKKFHLISHTHSESSDTLLMALIRHTTLHTGRGLESE